MKSLVLLYKKVKKIFFQSTKILLFSFLFSLHFFFFSSPVKADDNLVEAYFGEIEDYRHIVPQGTMMTPEELLLVNDQNLATTFSVGDLSQEGKAVMLFHFKVGEIEPAQAQLTFSWIGRLATIREENEIAFDIFDHLDKTWLDKMVLSKSIDDTQLSTLAIAFDEDGNTSHTIDFSRFNLENLVGPEGDVWMIVRSEWGNPFLTTAEVSLQVTTPASLEPETTVVFSGKSGENGWFIEKPVTISFSAVPSPLGETISKTEYSLDSSPFQTYAEPFQINNEGTTKILYRSFDDSGQIEGLKWAEVKIDTSPPYISTFGFTLVDLYDQFQDYFWELSPEETYEFALQFFFDYGYEPATVYCQLNQDPVTEVTNHLLTVNQPGSHLLECWAIDEAGLESSPHQFYSFNLDFAHLQETISTDGGAINTYYGDQLTIPDNELSDPTDITLKIVEPAEIASFLPQGAVVLPRAYQLGPSGTKFSNENPAIMVFKYSEADLKGANPHKLGVYLWDSSSNQWVFKKGKVDTLNQTLTVELDHFSLFILAIDNTPPTINLSPLVAENYLVNTNLSVSASDNLDGDVNLEATLNGIPVDPNQINLAEPGTSSLVITAQDCLGNTATKNFSFNVLSLTWLSPLSDQEVSTVQNNSTLPIKFSVLDTNGLFVADNSVKIEIYNSDHEVLDFDLEGGVRLQEEQYHSLLKTKEENLIPDLPYMIKVSFSSDLLSGSASTSFSLLENDKVK